MRPLKTLTALALLLAFWPAAPANAGVRIGIGIGLPCPGYGYYCGPRYYYPYPYGYYAPVPVVVAPSPVVVAQPVVAQPVVVGQPMVAQPTTGVQSADVASVPPPAPPRPLPEQLQSVPRTLTQAVAQEAPGQSAEIDRWMQQLRNPNDQGRAEAMITLGRLRSAQAVEPLKTALASDRSPVVREAAARGLGLIGAPSSLSALQQAAQADDDREVRSSARFAAEVIRSGR
jgi:HEAT repeats